MYGLSEISIVPIDCQKNALSLYYSMFVVASIRVCMGDLYRINVVVLIAVFQIVADQWAVHCVQHHEVLTIQDL